METCKTCIFWVDDEPGPYSRNTIMHPEDEDTYEEKVMPFEVRKCKAPSITLFERNPDPKGVSLMDGSCFSATMYTGPEFGCVNHEARQ